MKAAGYVGPLVFFLKKKRRRVLLKLDVNMTQVCAQCGQGTFDSVHLALGSTLQMHTTYTRLVTTGVYLYTSWRTGVSGFCSSPQRDPSRCGSWDTFYFCGISIDGSRFKPFDSSLSSDIFAAAPFSLNGKIRDAKICRCRFMLFR